MAENGLVSADGSNTGANVLNELLLKWAAAPIGAISLFVFQWVWKRFIWPQIQRLGWTGVRVEGAWNCEFDSDDGRKNYQSTIKLIQAGGKVTGSMVLYVRFKKPLKGDSRVFEVQLDGIVRGNALVLRSENSRVDFDLDNIAVQMCFLLRVTPDSSKMSGMQACGLLP